MKKIHLLGLGALLLGCSFITNAAPIVITQTFYDTNMTVVVNGAEQLVTGDWIFKGLTDTTAVDQSGFSNSGIYDVSLTLTQASLGLVDEPVTNIDTLFVISDSGATYQGLIGFGGLSGSPWTRTESVFSNPNLFPSISELNIARSTSSSNALGLFTTGYQLENGINISAVLIEVESEGFVYPVTYENLSSSMSTQVVPVPAAVWLFSSGLIGLVGFARRKKT